MSNFLSLSLIASVPLCSGHGAMNKPPAWQDPDGIWVFDAGQCAAGCKGDAATRPAEGCICEWYSNYTFIPGEPTIPPMSLLKTYADACQQGKGVDSCCSDYCQDPANQMKDGACEGCDWTRKMPWRAPGSAPVFSPCGFDGGNPEGCPVGNSDWKGCNGGGYGHGPDGRSLPGNTNPPAWPAGSVQEVAWGITANHGGGYQYRLCPKPTNSMDLTEECFQQMPLRFVGATQWVQKGTDESTRVEFPAMRTVTGTFPAGSQWTKNPIPACGTTGGGSHPSQVDCTDLGTQFPPPITGVEGFHSIPWNVIDNVEIPSFLPAGDYVVGFRYDCEQTSQVWQQCGDVRIVAAAPSPPSPPPTDNCDNPLCASCCTGSCLGCQGYCENVKDGDCANCWTASDGAPPCNMRGTQCLGNDRLSCEACWNSDPLPAFFHTAHPARDTQSTSQAKPQAKVLTNRTARAPTSQDACRTDIPECSSCCSGSCSACRGYCETNKGDSCAGCWTASDGAPPCNGRGTQCLADDGLSCELCWQAPPEPVPTPGPAPSPPAPSPTGCPGGSYAACIEACPSKPFDDFQSCLHLCQERCDDFQILA